MILLGTMLLVKKKSKSKHYVRRNIKIANFRYNRHEICRNKKSLP